MMSHLNVSTAWHAMTKRHASWFAIAFAVVVLSGCATVQVVAPVAVARQGSASIDVEVLDRRAEPVERTGLEAALRRALGDAAPRPGKLIIEVRDYQARFIQGDVAALLALGPLLGPAVGARTPVWHGVCHLWAIYQGADGKELGRWTVKGEKALPNTWGYRSAREALQAAFDEAIDRLVDNMALATR